MIIRKQCGPVALQMPINIKQRTLDGLIKMEQYTVDENPYCVAVGDGFVIKKGFYDKRVWIS